MPNSFTFSYINQKNFRNLLTQQQQLTFLLNDGLIRKHRLIRCTNNTFSSPAHQHLIYIQQVHQYNLHIHTVFYQNVKDHRPKSIILYANLFHNYPTAVKRAYQYQIPSQQSYLLYIAIVTSHATTRWSTELVGHNISPISSYSQLSTTQMLFPANVLVHQNLVKLNSLPAFVYTACFL